METRQPTIEEKEKQEIKKAEEARKVEELKKCNIYQKLSFVSRRCNTVYKDGKVEGTRGFTYATAGNVVGTVNENLYKSRLVAYVNYKLIESRLVDLVTRDGKNQTVKFAAVEATATIVNIDNPDEKINVSAFGYGQDPGDTAIGKAQTYALKYLWLSTLQIQQFDDPEKDFESNQNISHQSYNVKVA